jgi:polygalacturonase
VNVSILDFGAIADGVTLNTAAIQGAIDACAAAGGGTVTVPAGTFKCGSIWLRSHIELHLEAGAVLLASDNIDDYNEPDAYEQNFTLPKEDWLPKHLIIAHEVEGCAISGLGTINGNGTAFSEKFCDYPGYQNGYHWRYGISRLKDAEKKRPGQLICFVECKHVNVRDITICNSPCWSCLIQGSEFVSIHGVKIFNPVWMLNSDGIDIDASRYVTVSDCIIHTGDDAITLRACEEFIKNKDMHCEYVTVNNCVLHTGVCAFRLGGGTGLIRHARFSNIVVSLCRNIVQFCTAYMEKGCANIEDVNFSNISASDTDRVVEAFARNGAYIRNVTMENIRSTGTMKSYLDGEGGSIENFTLRNIEIRLFDRYTELSAGLLKARGQNALALHRAAGVKLENVTLNGELCSCEEQVSVTECPDLSKCGCNF